MIPLLGIYQEDGDDIPRMILPFVENGSVLGYLIGLEVPDSETAEIISRLVSLAYLARFNNISQVHF